MASSLREDCSEFGFKLGLLAVAARASGNLRKVASLINFEKLSSNHMVACVRRTCDGAVDARLALELLACHCSLGTAMHLTAASGIDQTRSARRWRDAV